jgi:hypothetical protein
VKKKKIARSTHKLTTLDDFLKREGKLEEFEAIAIKEVLAWQIGEAMKAQKALYTVPSFLSCVENRRWRSFCHNHGGHAGPAGQPGICRRNSRSP